MFLLGGESCLQPIKNTTFVKGSKVKCNKTRYACTSVKLLNILGFVGHKVSVTTTQLCYGRTKAATDSM